MKRIKKVIAGVLITACLALSFTACNDNNDSSDKNTINNNSNSQNNAVPSTQAPPTQAPNNSQPIQNPSGSILDFTLYNQTGVDIYQLYVSPSSQDQWGDDVLDSDILYTGNSISISFDSSSTSQYWDIMIVDHDGYSLIWTQIDLYTYSQITLSFDGSSVTASCQ